MSLQDKLLEEEEWMRRVLRTRVIHMCAHKPKKLKWNGNRPKSGVDEIKRKLSDRLIEFKKTIDRMGRAIVRKE